MVHKKQRMLRCIVCGKFSPTAGHHIPCAKCIDSPKTDKYWIK
jgi:hypothetical protein